MRKQKLYILITIVITLWPLIGCANKPETENVRPPIDAATFAETKSKAEKLFAQREDLAKLREAITLLAKLRNPDSRNYDVEWNFSKYNYFLGLHTGDEKEAGSAFEKGKDAGNIASKMEPQKPDGHFWYGANLGELCKRNPVTIGLRSVDDVREAMKKVIEIKPDYQGASAFDAIAQIELATRIKGGTPEKAVEYLEKGLSFEKENANIRLHLAEAYLAVNKDAEAKKQLDFLLRMKPNPEYLPEQKEAVKAAKKMLASKF